MKTSLRALALAGMLASSLPVVWGLSALPQPALTATASEGTGVITGQVIWCSPVPVAYGAPGYFEDEMTPELSPETSPEVWPDEAPVPRTLPFPVPRAPKPRLIPAGAVLVAVQGTALSARTDENGQFRIEGVPTGQYLTVAAGPVRGVSTAFVLRPNVFIKDAGQVVKLGRLSLGQSCGYGPLPYAVPGAAEAQSDEGP